MANSYRAPKQWALASDATVNQYEAWKNNLLFTLSLDSINAMFLKDGASWGKATKANPNRGFTDDDETVDATKRLTASQKATGLNLMLGQIGSYSPFNRSTIVKQSTSLNDVWKAIRLHYGFQANGARTLDLADMVLNPGERPEELYQRLLAFVDDNLMKADGGVKHLNAVITEDEETTPTLENFVVVWWLKILHKDLPKLVKQRYGTELRTNSVASIKGEISGALDSLLEEIQTTQDSKVLRSVILPYKQKSASNRVFKECPLCKQAGRTPTDHYLTVCKHLPERDRKFLSKSRTVQVESEEEDEEEEDNETLQHRRVSVDQEEHSDENVSLIARRVPVIPSPFLDCFVKHFTVRVTVDSGATGNVMRHDVAKRLKLTIRKPTQRSHQADGNSSLDVVGEVTVVLNFKGHNLVLEALVAATLDDEILGGTPFMVKNDVWLRPSKEIIGIGDRTYDYKAASSRAPVVRRVQTTLIRSPSNTTVWPGDFVELEVPIQFAGEQVGIEPRIDSNINTKSVTTKPWPEPQLVTCCDNTIRIPNTSSEPLSIKKGDHLCQIVRTVTVDPKDIQDREPRKRPPMVANDLLAFKEIVLDPDNITPPEYKERLECICESYSHVFSPKFKGYNGRDGAVKAVVNMGPALPPQRKGRVPQYNKDKLDIMQDKFDELKDLGVFIRPEDADVIVEYLNPCMLIKKTRGGYRLVTEFGEIARYAKPQPSLLPDMNSVLRWLAQWKFIICTDLCKAYYQVPLDPKSMKYCGVSTPYKGTLVYTTAAMGMPGSESALEEVVSRVFGSLIQSDQVMKIADNLFTGGNTLDELCRNWEQVLKAASRNSLNFSPSQTIINPKTTTILGWVWSQGTLSANPHSICTLKTCETPKNVKELKSFIGAYKVLSRVVPDCAKVIAPLDNVVSGRASTEKLVWSEQMETNFRNAKDHLDKATSIKMPRRSDKLWIVLDAATRSPGIGATLYVGENNCNLKIGGFFSAKLKSNQIDWLPCEREALGIAGAVKHFQPYITQSEHQTTILTDNRPCVQAFEKAQKGEFSASPRVSTFLSVCHRFQVAVKHISGAQNMLSDHQSRNPAMCEDSCCQICRFLTNIEESVVRAVSINEVLSGKSQLPFLTRSAWKSTQHECPDLRRTHAHLSQGTRPSKKQTKIRDVKRYLQKVDIAKDGLIIVRSDEVASAVRERIVVPRDIFKGLLISLHLKLDHPTTNQLKQVVRRYFFALDMDSCIEEVATSCHTCSALSNVKKFSDEQTTSDPPNGVCTQFAADVIRREKQFIFLLRDIVTSYTWSSFIANEQSESLRTALLKLCIPIRPIDGPKSVVRVDPAPGFRGLQDDALLESHNIILDLGRAKNQNKNPVTERGVQELEQELLKQEPSGGQVSELLLATATARLNARIRQRGLSAREMLFQRDQFTNDQIPLLDRDMISEQHQAKLKNHEYSEKSKAPNRERCPDEQLTVGDLVYLHNDGSKLKARDRYIVASMDNQWVYLRKFVGKQLRNSSYKVKRSECYKVPAAIPKAPIPVLYDDGDDENLPKDRTPVVPTGPIVNDSGEGDLNQSEHLLHVDHDATCDDIIGNNTVPATDLTIPEAIVPLLPPVDTDTCARPSRTRQPPDRLSMNWNSKSYTD